MSEKNGFDNISKALNVDFSDVDGAVDKLQRKKKEIEKKIESDDLTLQDKNFMQSTLKSMIKSGEMVLETVRKDIRIGADNRKIEVYFNGMSKISDTIKSLMNLNTTIEELKIKKNKGAVGGNKITVNQFLSSTDLLKMVNNARTNSSVKEIRADFSIEDDGLVSGD